MIFIQREKTFVLILKMFGHGVLGNFMGVVTAFSVAAFAGGTAVDIVVSVVAFALYHMMIFASAYKGAFHEKKLIRMKVIESDGGKKWIRIGAISGAIMLAPIIALIILLSVLGAEKPDFILLFRFISGANFSAVMWLPPDKYTFAPFVYMLVYILTPLSSFGGYKLAFNERLTLDRIIYKQKK